MGACLTPPLSVARPLHPLYCNRLTFHNGSSHGSKTPTLSALHPSQDLKQHSQTSRPSSLHSTRQPFISPTYTSPQRTSISSFSKCVLNDTSTTNASFPQRNKTYILRTCTALVLFGRVEAQIGDPTIDGEIQLRLGQEQDAGVE